MIARVRQRDGHRVEVLPEEQLKLGGRVSLSQPQERARVRQDERQPFPGPPDTSGSAADAEKSVRGAGPPRVGIVSLALVWEGVGEA